jgi:hypothetical protein
MLNLDDAEAQHKSASNHAKAACHLLYASASNSNATLYLGTSIRPWGGVPVPTAHACYTVRRLNNAAIGR